LTDLAQRLCIVVGGGKVASRKVIGLLEAGAAVTVISPVLDDTIQHAASQEQIRWIARPYQEGDLAGAFLVIAATDDAPVNHAVFAEAELRHILVNVVDDPQHSNFILPAQVRRGDLRIAISTGGASPALARRLREKLEADFGPEYTLLVQLLDELRPRLLERFAPGEARLQAALQLIDSDLLTVLREAGYEAGKAYTEQLWEERLASNS
jgi:precorrin-2 dehydrogenase/sirohydrochlorin ferrochelatase